MVTEKPVHEQESLAPVAMQAPVYSDEKLHRISLGGVAPGTIVDYNSTVQTLKPIIPGDFPPSVTGQPGLRPGRPRRPPPTRRILPEIPVRKPARKPV